MRQCRPGGQISVHVGISLLYSGSGGYWVVAIVAKVRLRMSVVGSIPKNISIYIRYIIWLMAVSLSRSGRAGRYVVLWYVMKARRVCTWATIDSSYIPRYI